MNGVSLREAPGRTCIPVETLRRWFAKEPSWAGSGRFQTVLTAEKEQLIVVACKRHHDWAGLVGQKK